jgi:2-oxo-4-hydroxy-4-carboxy-5-ureidoimidazoline decarboxylase
MTQHTLEELNGLSIAAFTAALGGVFEHSPWVAQAAAVHRPFATVAALHEAMITAVRGASHAQQLEFLCRHPELGGLEARAGSLTADSTAEQASLGLQALPRTDTELFARQNASYRSRFGFPFIICVRHHTRDAILQSFERRLENDAATEMARAFAEIDSITRLRLVANVSGPGLPKTAGHLSTHILDTAAGRPAADVAVALHQIGPRGEGLIVAATTNADGRTDAPLISGVPLRIGVYELLFHIGDYFHGAGQQTGSPAFLDIVPVRFSITEPVGHYHVPLLATPWSYTTYRGS